MATRSHRRHTISRRRFLTTAGALAAGLLTGSCQAGEPEEAAQATPSATPSPQPTAQPTGPPTTQPTAPPTPRPTVPPATSTPAGAPTNTSAATPTSAPPPEPLARVAIARAQSYDPDIVRDRLRELLDGLGGLDDVVSAGDRVAIKVNLVGGSHFEPPPGVTAIESYMTHPELVRALGRFLRDAGARDLFIVEAIYDADSFSVFGYDEVAADLGAVLVDLNSPAPHNEFGSAPVGAGAFIYDDIVVNRLLNEVDSFVSFTKMKCHYNAGVSLSMKNLVGLLPADHYRLAEDHWWRSAVHGDNHETPARLPRAIVDLNRARPVHLALIDGIKAAEGGEVPRGTFSPVAPGVLLAGKNAVATDAVATATMGFDPTVEPPTPPFVRGDNTLNLARELGLGTNRLEEIAIVGDSIEDVRYQYETAWRM